jgi:hypothetical protein
MLNRLCLGLTLPLMLGAALAAQMENLPAGWRVFTSKEGRFAIAVPGAPEETKLPVLTATANLDVRLFVVETNEGTYVASYCDLPPEEVKAGTEQKRLDLARDGAVNNAKGKLKSEKERKLDGNPGRELEIEADKGHRIRMRIVAVQQRLYQTMVMGSTKFTHSKDAARFLDSLRLVK